MTTIEIDQLRVLEGRRVGLALRGGDRIDDCQLVSAGRADVPTVWLFADGHDEFVALDDVLALWEIRAA